MRVAVCVDDTDDLTKVTSTGAVADALAQLVVSLGGEVELGVTRHQLPRLAEIAYTSHNSSMAFTALLPSEDAYEALLAEAPRVVVEGSVPDADPGLCIFALPGSDGAEHMRVLFEYGARAKREYVTKDEAYGTAASIPRMSLSEHGGGGEGVIGALAGVALRLSGTDGRFRGTRSLFGDEPHTETVAVIVEMLGGPNKAQVCDLEGARLPDDRHVIVPPRVKPVLQDSRITLLAGAEGDTWHVLDRIQVRDLKRPMIAGLATCDEFEADNDAEEMEGRTNEHVCINCLYRRQLEQGILCMKRLDV